MIGGGGIRPVVCLKVQSAQHIYSHIKSDIADVYTKPNKELNFDWYLAIQNPG